MCAVSFNKELLFVFETGAILSFSRYYISHSFDHDVSFIPTEVKSIEMCNDFLQSKAVKSNKQYFWKRQFIKKSFSLGRLHFRNTLYFQRKSS